MKGRVNQTVWLVTLALLPVMVSSAYAEIKYVPGDFLTMQTAIDDCNDGDVVIVATGRYYENIHFQGKNITLTSTNPKDSNIVAATVIDGNNSGSVVIFAGTETADCLLTGFTITGGHSPKLGGGIRGYGTGATIANCVITHNIADDEGGGVNYCKGIIRSCVITHNFAHQYGGGLCRFDGTVSNCLIIHNSAGYGGGISACGNIINCTIVSNTAAASGGGLYHNYSGGVTNCIIWDNLPDQIYHPVYPTIYSCIQGGWPGVGNINADPMFVDANNGDYHLLSDSPCINAGDPNYVPGPNETDIDGEPRIMNGRIDIGADEYHIIYVDVNAPGANDGSSWENAYNFLQDALADANSSIKPVDIRVAQGIYKPDEDTLHPNGTGNREAAFQLINGVTLKGGYAGFGEPDPDARDITLYQTILSGDLAGNDVDVNDPSDLLTEPTRAENSYHIFYHPEDLNLDATAILDGFTIIGSNANGGGVHNYGGGLCNFNSSPTVKDCTFTNNSAQYGGGMYNTYKSSPTVMGCTFSINLANKGGGGMYNDYYSSPMVNACTFSGNSATYGGGMFNTYESKPTVKGCTFSENSVNDWGGGMYNYESSLTVKNCTFSGNSAGQAGGGMCNMYSSPTVRNCTFSGNSANKRGGGMIIYYGNPTVKDCTFSNNSAKWAGGMDISDSNPTLEGCIFTSNSATYGGGMGNGYSSPIVKGCTFSGNSAITGGGMFNYESSSTVEGCTFTANSAKYGGGMYNDQSDPTVTSCILWADVPSEIYGDAPAITYSDVQGGYAGTGNINADPMFVDANNGDYHLLPDSPCINAGDPNYVAGPNETDMDGELRVMLGRVDMGADEFNPFEVTFDVINKRRIDRTIFEYGCEVTLTNISRFTVRNVQLEIVKASNNMVIIDPNVTFGDVEIGPGQSASSIDTCSFQVDRSQAIEPAEIIWWSGCELVATGQTMQHSGSSVVLLEKDNIAGDITGDGKVDIEDLAELAGQWLGPPGIASADIEPMDGDGIVNFLDFARLVEDWQGL